MIIQIRPNESLTLRPHYPKNILADGVGPGEDDVFQVNFDASEDSIIAVIVRSVSVIRNVEPTELDPLSKSVDTDMLCRMVDEGGHGKSHGGEFSFNYEGFQITVDTEGYLWLERL